MKNSALIAVDSKTGKNRFFKLSDNVTLLDKAATDNTESPSDSKLSFDSVMAAFDEALDMLQAQLADTDVDTKKSIVACREKFLGLLKQ